MARSVPSAASKTSMLHMLHMLVVMLVLLGRLLGPASMALMSAERAAQDIAQAGVICHAGDGSGGSVPEPGRTPGHAQDCQLCPACHISTLAVLPDSSPSVVWLTGTRLADQPAPPPPPTGPPHAVRLAARPTGPPTTVA